MTPEEVLFKLGQLEPDEIARVMKDAGVLALRSSPSYCAVTQYVYNETRATDMITGSDILVCGRGENFHYVWLPESVRRFVQAFDEGAYPELDAFNPDNQVA